MIHFKRLVYLALKMLLKNSWRVSGGRREEAMGLSLNLHPDTVWPERRGLKLPHENCRSKIVAFADLVQVHAVCNAITCLPLSPVIIDVGAHHGEYALLAGGLSKAQGGIVIAIEPEKTNASILKNNISRNALENVIQVVETAISDVSGEIEFVSEGSESRMLTHCDKVPSGSRTIIKVETLRDVISRFALDRVDLLLVDVEGAELNVLNGFPWEKMQPSMIFCELHPYNWAMFGYSGQDMADFLQLHQYRCLDMYFQEHPHFYESSYLGPCLFLPRQKLTNGEEQSG